MWKPYYEVEDELFEVYPAFEPVPASSYQEAGNGAPYYAYEV